MDKFLQLLSLARRAGKVALGYDAAVGAVMRGASLVVLSRTLAERTQRNIHRVCEDARCALYEVDYDTDTLKHYIGKATGIVAVTDANLAKALVQAGAVARPAEAAGATTTKND